MDKNFYSPDNGGYVVIKTFGTSAMRFLKRHRDVKAVNLWFEGMACPNLDFLLQCENVEQAAIYGGKIDDYSALGEMPRLKELFMNGCLRKWLSDFDFLRNVTSLESLKIFHYPTFARFPDLRGLNRLETVEVFGCKRFSEFDSIIHIPNLKDLTLDLSGAEDAEFLMDIPGLSVLYCEFGTQKRNKEFVALARQHGFTQYAGNRMIKPQLMNAEMRKMYGCAKMASPE